jgi:hypothetical protein
LEAAAVLYAASLMTDLPENDIQAELGFLARQQRSLITALGL